MTDPQRPVYVYGVVSSAAPPLPPIEGVAAAPVQKLAHGGLAALASPIETTELGAREVRAHWRVLEHAFEQGTVLPVRFGTIMESEDAVHERLLEPNAARLSELLETMAGLIQLNLKGRYDEEVLLRALVREQPGLAQLRDRVSRTGAMADRIALGQTVEQAIGRRRATDTAIARQALDRLAVQTREDPVNHPQAFNLAFLVARDDVDAFGQGVAGVREQLGEWMDLRYVGPVPPFSFADTDLAQERAWA